MNNLILTSINTAIDQITFPQKRHYPQAKTIVQSVFNKTLGYNNDLSEPVELSDKYFSKIIKSDGDRAIILRELKNAEIILTDGTYTTAGVFNGITKRSKAKSYIINPLYIYKSNISFTQFKGINKQSNKLKFDTIKKELQLVTINEEVFNFIPQLVEKELKKIIIGNDINKKMITIGKQTLPRKVWQTLATQQNVQIIQFKDKFYLEGVRTLQDRKRVELTINYVYNMERLKIGDYYANRNETNNRLDYNLTSVKKELFDYIKFDNEETTEIDIANSQFAILANLDKYEIDNDFKENAVNGTLYKYIGNKLGKTIEETKEYMMLTSFGKIEHHPVEMIEHFPLTMKSLTDHKLLNGYEDFSITLQKAESNLMIDGVFFHLLKNKIKCLPVHDSMRVRKSDEKRAEELIKEFLDKKNIKLKLRTK